jgi:hypothetical protein
MKVRGMGGHLGLSDSKRPMVSDPCTASNGVSFGDALDSSSRTPPLLTRLLLFVVTTGGSAEVEERLQLLWLETWMGRESWN